MCFEDENKEDMIIVLEGKKNVIIVNFQLKNIILSVNSNEDGKKMPSEDLKYLDAKVKEKTNNREMLEN